MKEITKHRLNQVNRLLKIGLVTFCWLMAGVGITAYSIYWLRQNANYEQEASKREIKPRKSVVNEYVYFTLYDTSYYYDDSVDGDNYMNALSNLVSGSRYYNYYLDFYTDNTQCNRFYSYCNYYAGAELEGYLAENISVWDVNGNRTYLLTCYPSTGYEDHFPYSFADFNYLKFSYNDLQNHADLYAFLKASFREIDYSQFEFTSDYNFATLTSEVVTSERLIIPYNNQYNGDPSDELVEFYIKADFISNNVVYKGILFVLNKPIYVYKDGLQQVNFRGSLSQLMVKQVYYMKNLPQHMPYENYPLDFSLTSDCDLVANKHILKYEDYDDGQSTRQYPVYDYKQYDWVNQSYRLLQIDNNSYNSTYYPVFYPTDNTMWSNRLYYGLTLYQVLNNGYYDYNYKTNTYTTGASNDLSQVFTLLSGAFGGLTSLMYIQVLPGISLGLLFFVPLIITIIIVVLRLVKK